MASISPILEKGNIVTSSLEDVNVKHQSQTSKTDARILERKLIRRLDWQILPWLCLLYALSLIDRTNISAAKVTGMSKDLKLTGNKYNIALITFFATYTATQLPSNAFIRKIGPKDLLTIMVVGWGVTAMCFGFVKTFGQLAGLRVLLGLFEGGFNPACIYLISSWYKRYETHKRLAIWYVSGSVVAGFNGILSYGLSLMEGVGGLRGWRWIFIVPGILTVILAVPIFLLVADFPEKATFLNTEERDFVRQRLHDDRGEVLEDTMTWAKAMDALKDWKVWAHASLLLFPTAGAYTMAFFTPSILASFGFSIALSQILVTPPSILAAIFSIATGFWADKIQRRTPFIIGYLFMTIIGFIMMGWGNNTGCKLTGVFLSVIGNNCAIPAVLAFLSDNITGTSKRAISVPLQTVLGGLGGIIGSLIFREKDYPKYRPGIYSSSGLMALAILMTAGLATYYKKENERADEQGKQLQGLEGFRYTL